MVRQTGRGRRYWALAQNFDFRLALTSAWSLVLRIAGLASTFLLGVVLARGLGPAEYGVYGLVTTIAALLMTVTLLGTPQLAVRDFSILSQNEDWAGVRQRLLQYGLSTTLAGLLIGIAATLATQLAGAETRTVLLVAQGGVLTLLMGITALAASMLRGLGAMIKGQVMDILVRPGLVFLLALLILASGRSIDAVTAIWLQVLVTLASSLVSILWIVGSIPRGQRRLLEGQRPFRLDWLRTAIPLGIVDMLRQLSGSYSVIFVGWIASAVDLGIFRVAVACGVVAAMPVTIFHIVFAPKMAQLNETGRTRELQQLLSGTTTAMLAIMVPATLASWFLGRLAISFAFGAQYAGAWLPLFFLCLAQLVNAAFGMGPILLAMCGGERRLTIIYIVAVGAGVLLTWPMTWRWGPAGAAAATNLTSLLIGLGSRDYGKRLLGVDVCFRPYR
jgi:O-antigen/teichoic acid export membrane protein